MLLSEEKEEKVDEYRARFIESVNDDLNTPKAMAIMWEVLKSNIPSVDKYDLVMNFDEVFGLKLNETETKEIPEEIGELLKQRIQLRNDKKYDEADEIRKKIGKQQGDMVHVILFPDNEPLEVPDEMLACLQDEPSALKFFRSLSESEQKFYIDWVYSAKKEETKIDRLAKCINRLQKGLKLYDKNH